MLLTRKPENFPAAQSPLRPFRRSGSKTPQERAEALGMLLRVCLLPISDENRDGDRTPAGGRVNSVSPVPARIALQGGETRGRRSDYQQSSGNLANSACPCPQQDKGEFGTCLARPTAPGPGSLAANRRVAPSTPHRLSHGKRGSLANPIHNIKKPGRGQ